MFRCKEELGDILSVCFFPMAEVTSVRSPQCHDVGKKEHENCWDEFSLVFDSRRGLISMILKPELSNQVDDAWDCS